MSNGNPFFIEPAAGTGLLTGLGALATGYMRGQEQEAQLAAQQRAQQRIQAALASEDIGQIQDVMVEFPEMRQSIQDAFQLSGQDQLRRAFDILGGAEGAQVLGERAQMLDANGIPADETRAGMGLTPQQQRQGALATIAAMGSPAQIQLAREMMAGPEQLTPYQREQIRLEENKLEMRRLENEQRQLDRELSKATNELKRRELEQKLAANEAAREQNKADRRVAAEDAVNTVNTTLSSIERVLAHPGLDMAVGLTSIYPTIPGSQSADFEAQLESLKSQAFLSEVEKMRGLGALTEREGARLESALGALDLSQSESAFRKELRRVRDIMKAAKSRAEARVPEEPDLPEQLPGATEGEGTLQVQEGRIAVNPQTGERLILRGGQWVPIGY